MKLLNTSKETFKIVMTKNPITNPEQSPRPTGIRLSDCDLSTPKGLRQKEEILNHPNYSESEEISLKSGVNEFKNEEHAEYFYKTLGQFDYPEDDRARMTKMKNDNIVFEVEEAKEVDGKWEFKEIKDNLYKKYRGKPSVNINTTVSPEQFKLQE